MERFSVLVVDDEERILNFIRIKLKASGFDVLTARDGFRAIELVRAGGIDAIVLDLVMPRKDGLKTLKEVREISEVPVIVISARTADMETLKSESYGHVELLPKPFRPEALVQRLEALRDKTLPAHNDVSPD